MRGERNVSYGDAMYWETLREARKDEVCTGNVKENTHLNEKDDTWPS